MKKTYEKAVVAKRDMIVSVTSGMKKPISVTLND